MKDMETNYSTGNYRKHKSGNPIKRYLVGCMDKMILEAVRCSMPSGGGQRFLDAGCGEGFTLQKIESLYKDDENQRLFGVDFSEKALTVAKTMTTRTGYMQGSLYELPFEDGYFHTVLCSEVLEHLEEPDKACLELARVTKNVLIITVPHEPWFCLGNLCSFKNVTRLGNDIEHINHWTGGSFEKLIHRNFAGWGKASFSRSFPWLLATIKRKE